MAPSLHSLRPDGFSGLKGWAGPCFHPHGPPHPPMLRPSPSLTYFGTTRENWPLVPGRNPLGVMETKDWPSPPPPLWSRVTHREVPEALQSSTRDMRVLGSLQTKIFCLSSLAASFMTQLQCHVMSVVWLSPRPTARSLTAPTSL